ncbi:CPBP family intramembrane glutamic endopeptidase [Enterococcus gilvus]|uniref:CPBP family intramembrane glutamic endopeptidase n=1 Tax=Enterococcus gilvus TaxID=160453 RepID=UPI001C8B6832|nr:CPBP family intramembrane glutamic endopeptidase [Enterococcus gilvus]MBX8938118.1 CPBP family intramembrane metalloprotease [Enterococcus gilvus]
MKEKAMLKIIGLLVILQFLRLGLKQLFFLFIKRTNFSDHLASMLSFLLLTALIVVICKRRKIALPIFPPRFSRRYLFATDIVGLLLVTTPANYSGGIEATLLLIYSSIVTPIFEELIFRGGVWNQLSVIFKRAVPVYLWSSVLFGIWHLGYFDSLAFRVGEGLPEALIWKVITGLCYGLVLGLLRLRTKNCYSTMLLHGAMNIFGR